MESINQMFCSRSLILSLILIFGRIMPALAQTTTIDLTHNFNAQAIFWPTERGFKLEKIFRGQTDKGHFYAANRLYTPEHGGTHLDAPLHFAKDHLSIEQIPLSQLFGDAAVIDVRPQVGNNKDYAITPNDITTWEKIHGKLGPKHIVLFNTGWARFWGNKKKYLGTDLFKDVDHLRFPGLSAEAATYLVQKKVKGVGLDTSSLDPGLSTDFQAHRILLGADIYGLENLENLEKLPATGARLIVAPMKIEGGTGAPTRVFAEF